MSDIVIKFEGVGKSYPLYTHIVGGLKLFILNLPKSISSFRNSRYEALRDITFDVRKGESFGIIGRNGAGKSTLLGLVAGVLRPNSGRITVRERTSPLLELGAGFHPDLTGRENILLNGVLLGLTKKQVMRVIDEIIDFSELGEFIDQPIRVYSSGMTAKLGFSVIAHLDPKILLIDEVLAVGDASFQAKCVKKMLEFRNNGVTMFFVSHSMDAVKQICDRVLWIEDHVMKMIGEPEAVTNAYLAQFQLPSAVKEDLVER